MAIRIEDRWSDTDSTQISILGLPVARRDTDTALRELIALHARPGGASCYFVNAHSVNQARRNPAYAASLRRADLVLNDGVGVELAAMVRGRSFLANLNGTDLTPRLLDVAAQQSWSVYLLGSSTEVVERAARRIGAAVPGLHIVGTHHGFFDDGDPELTAELARLQPDLLLVGMGNPRQELFIDSLLAQPTSPARLAVGVGAFFDFAAGELPRAPRTVRLLRLEWAWRLALEPGRLWRRYLLDNWQFLGRVAFDRWNVPPAWEPKEPPMVLHLVGQSVDLSTHEAPPVVRRAGTLRAAAP